MKIRILCVGKIKERFYTAAAAEYMKRLSRYCKPEIVELQDEKTPDGCSDAEAAQIKEKEGARILSAIRAQDYVIALAIDGKKMDSVAFAQTIERLGVSGVSDIDFVIGGSLGLADAVFARSNEKLSFSDLTFPHQLMRIILLEQIYRGFRIIRHEPYHK